jgi:hypothetical protein
MQAWFTSVDNTLPQKSSFYLLSLPGMSLEKEPATAIWPQRFLRSDDDEAYQQDAL